eukprot:397650_1
MEIKLNSKLLKLAMSDLQEWILTNGYTQELYDILIQEEINDMETLTEIPDNELMDILKQTQLKLGRKLKFKKAVKNLRKSLNTKTNNDKPNVLNEYKDMLLQELEIQKTSYKNQIDSIPQNIESSKHQKNKLNKNICAMYEIFINKLKEKEEIFYNETNSIYAKYIQSMESKKQLYNNKIESIKNINNSNINISNTKQLIDSNKTEMKTMDIINDIDNDIFDKYFTSIDNLKNKFIS